MTITRERLNAAIATAKKREERKTTNQKIQFRLIQMPCCHILICWANPRRPNYCPECGKFIFKHFPRAKWDTTYSEAWLRVMDDDKANYNCEG